MAGGQYFLFYKNLAIAIIQAVNAYKFAQIDP